MHQNMKKVILSFDYELFFGFNSGTVKNTLIIPTNKMLETMEKVGAIGTFFVDYLMLKNLKLQGTVETLSDLELIEHQLEDIIRRGHRIELHIHSHWVDAKYKGNGFWDFSDFSHYSLNSFTESEICDFFFEGVSVLTEIARRVDSDYQIVAFRAGGWCILPFRKFVNAFTKSEIKVDSSSVQGLVIQNDYSYLDFTKIPSAPMYSFSSDIHIEENDGIFKEFPISSFKYTFLYRIINAVEKIIFKERFTLFSDGTHSRKQSESKSLSIPNFIRKFKTKIASYTLDGFASNIISRAVSNHPNNLMVFISHPKDHSNISYENVLKLSKQVTFTSYFKEYNEINN